MFRNIVYSLITKGTVALINFFVLIISSRYLGVNSRGEISIFILNITIIQIINEVYTGYSIIHFIPKFNLKKMMAMGVIYTLLFCSLSNVIVVFLNKQVSGYGWLGYVVSLLVIINTFNCVIILGKENIKMYNFLSFMQPFLLLLGIGFYIWVLKKYTFISYAYPLLFSFIMAFVFSTYIVSKYLLAKNNTEKFELKPILVNGFIFQLATLTYIFGNRYSYYLLPDSEKVGLYASASSLMESVLIISNSIAPVLLARVANEGNTVKSAEVTLSLSKMSFVFSILAVAVIFLLPQDLFVFIMGEGFIGIKKLMMIYAPGILMISVFAIISSYFSAIGKQKLVLLCYSFGFLIVMFIAPGCIQKYQTEGAAYVANIAYFIMGMGICSCFFIINKFHWRKIFSIKQDYKNLIDLISPKN